MASLVATKCEHVLTGVVSNTTWMAPQSRVVPVSGTILLSWPGAVCLPLSEAPNGRLGLRSGRCSMRPARTPVIASQPDEFSTPGIAGSVWRPAIHRSARRRLRHPAVIACQPVVREARRFFEIVACGRCRDRRGSPLYRLRNRKTEGPIRGGRISGKCRSPRRSPGVLPLGRPNRGRNVSDCPNR